MNHPPVSVIVVSRGRPELLARCLTGLGQLYYREFEIIVVSDPDGGQAVQTMGWGERVKLVAFDKANISAARNAGIAQAAGPVVAFIDDDAVPEPTWLSWLTAPFSDPAIDAVGGYVRGRNGISFQWRASLVSHAGETVALDVGGANTFVPDLPVDHAVKTEGTNCAFRRGVLAELGGFDPVFRFFHDESDLNMRLMKAGSVTAIAPLAQVHHGYASSERRGADRAPSSLFEIGASSAVFLRKHALDAARSAKALARLMSEQRLRLIRHMVAGGLEPRDVARLMADLRAGIKDGGARKISPLMPIAAPETGFLAFRRTNATGKALYLAGGPGSRARLYRQAARKVRAGNVVSVYRLSPTALFHHVRFRKEGFWEQTGGIFGRSERTGPIWQWARLRMRAEKENKRVAPLRQNSDKYLIPDDVQGLSE